MHRFIRAAIRIAFWGAVLAAVASAVDLAQPEPVPDYETWSLHPGEFRGPTIRDILNACSAAGDTTSADAIDDPGPSTGRWRLSPAAGSLYRKVKTDGSPHPRTE
jgi:hypothetical protein